MNKIEKILLPILAFICIVLGIISVDSKGFFNVKKNSPKKNYSIIVVELNHEMKDFGNVIFNYYFIFNEKDEVVDTLVNEKFINENVAKKRYENIKLTDGYNLKLERQNIKYNNVMYYRKNKEDIKQSIVYEKNLKKYNIKYIEI